MEKKASLNSADALPRLIVPDAFGRIALLNVAPARSSPPSTTMVVATI